MQTKQTMENHTPFNPSMKMANIISANYALLTVLPRFGISLGFGESSVNDICKKESIDTNLFIMVCNIYTFPNFTPDINSIKLNVDSLIAYLKKSHDYYLEEKILTIEKQLLSISKNCQIEHKDILLRFFEEYKNEVINHFLYEETEVFPYIRNLTQGKATNLYHIDRFEQNHSNIEDKLSDLKNILIKYLKTTNTTPHQHSELLLNLFQFEEELSKHQLIEEHILIPVVERIEKELQQ